MDNYVPDHPDIVSAERTGYPREYGERETFRCPSCGEIPRWDDDLFFNDTNEIIGCSRCIHARVVDDYLS